MTCTKTTYRNERRARREARKVGDRNGDRLWAYRCDRCNFWHLTSKPRGETLPVGIWKGRLSGRKLKPGQTLEELAQEMREGR